MILRGVYFFLSFTLLIDFVVYVSYGISLRGQWADKILLWGWLILTPVFIFQHRKHRWARRYRRTLYGFTILTLLPMGIPFLLIVNFAICFDTEIRIDEYIIRDTTKGIMSQPTLWLSKITGPFEREIGKTEIYYFEVSENRIKDIRLIEQQPPKFVGQIQQQLVELIFDPL